MRGVTITCPKCATEMPAAFSFCGKCGARLLALAPNEGETKQVTVLFADISGFTALAERLGREELHETVGAGRGPGRRRNLSARARPLRVRAASARRREGQDRTARGMAAPSCRNGHDRSRPRAAGRPRT